MEAGDRMGPTQGRGASLGHLDRLARGVLRAAREAAREIDREPPEPERRAWALGKLAGQTQAMLGPVVPDHPPVEAAAQKAFVRTALALAVHVRAHSWAEADLGPLGVLGADDVPHPGERLAQDSFDVLGRLMLPNASAEGWTATLVTDLARGKPELETAVKLGKYVLHPTFLAFLNDATREIGVALHGINVRRLHELTHSLRHYATGAGPAPETIHGPHRSGPDPARRRVEDAERKKPKFESVLVLGDSDLDEVDVGDSDGTRRWRVEGPGFPLMDEIDEDDIKRGFDPPHRSGPSL